MSDVTHLLYLTLLLLPAGCTDRKPPVYVLGGNIIPLGASGDDYHSTEI